MATYNGHKNWNHWNVSLWINNDERLYRLAQHWVCSTSNREEAARRMVEDLRVDSETTPDGAMWSVSAVRAAMVGM